MKMYHPQAPKKQTQSNPISSSPIPAKGAGRNESFGGLILADYKCILKRFFYKVKQNEIYENARAWQ